MLVQGQGLQKGFEHTYYKKEWMNQCMNKRTNEQMN